VAAIVLVLLLGGLLTVLRPRPTRSLEQRLTPYVSAPSTERASGPQSVSILRHVGHSTERALGELKFWKGIARLIERADMPLRTAELFYVMVGRRSASA
jgi:uncharacterized protein YjeT (DUF2065 family)